MIDGERHLRAIVMDRARSRRARICALNDDMRRHGDDGVLRITAGVHALGVERLEAVLRAVTEYDAFDAIVDPYDEHDLGVLRVLGVQIIWQINYLDRDQQLRSPDPTDPNVTTRILTVMLASDYREIFQGQRSFRRQSSPSRN